MPTTSLFEVVKVKWIRQKLKGPIKQLHPEWLEVDGYFCLPDPNYFAVGFLLDHKPSISEINVFSLPLFSNKVNFHLSYAEKIIGEKGEINIIGKKPKVIAQEFSSKVSPLIDKATTKDDLNWFTDLLEEREIFGSTRFKYDYGLALILQGRNEEATTALKEVSECEWQKKVMPEDAETAGKLATLLENTPKIAFNEVVGYLEKNRRVYGSVRTGP